MLTSDPNDPKLKEGQKNPTGQHEIYLVLSEEERAKGFVRPVRRTYVHIGKKVEKEGEIISLEEALKDGSDFAKNHFTKENGFAAYLKYPEHRYPLIGRYLTEDEYNAILSGDAYVGGCDTSTTMGQALAETYARDPEFYGATFCVHCNKHFPVEEFVWEGTKITVGS